MIVQNYPQGFIGSVGAITPNEIEKDTKSVEVKDYSVSKSSPTNEYTNITNEIKRLEKTLYRIQSGKSQASSKTEEMIQKRLSSLYEARDNLQSKGLAFYTEKKLEVPTATSKDVVVTPSGFQSKASSLQTQQEKEATNLYISKLISTSEGVKYKGDINGSVSIGSSNRINPYDNVASMDNTKGVSKTIPQSSVKSTIEVFGKPTLYSQILRKQSEAQELARKNPEQAGFYNIRGYVYGAISVPVLIFTQPKEFGKGIVYSFTHPLESAQSVGQELKNQPEFFIGQQIGTYGTFKGIRVIGEFGKSTYIKTGSTYIPTEKVFSSQVLSEGKTFPMSKGTSYALEQFKGGEVQTSAPSPLSDNVAGIGKKAGLGLEDPGIYVTPKGEGSPAFLGVSKQQGYSFTLNPFKPIKQFFQTPTVTEFIVKDVRQIPREIVSQPGFEPVKTFFEKEGAKTGSAYITKRSELGQGEIVPQLFKTKEGTIIKEFGTSELEAVVPYSAKFEYTPKKTLGKIKGFEEYTTYEGMIVPIRKARVLGEQDLINAPKSRSITGTVEEASLESSKVFESKSTSPTSSIKYAYVSSYPLGISSMSEIKPNNYSVSKLPESSSSLNLPSGNVTELILPSIITPSYTPKLSTPSVPREASTTSMVSIPSKPTPSVPSITFTPKYIPPTKFDFTSGVPESKKKSSKSKLFIRKKGKFELRGESEDIGSLFKKGRDIIENTAQASFKVVSESGKAILPNVLPSKFTTSKKDRGVLVQKRQFRISTAGEKREITYKGIQARRLI